MPESSEEKPQVPGDFRVPFPVYPKPGSSLRREDESAFRPPENINQNNATTYGSRGTVFTNPHASAPVQPSNSWPLCPQNQGDRGSLRSPPGVSRPHQHEGHYGSNAACGPTSEGSVPLYHLAPRSVNYDSMAHTQSPYGGNWSSQYSPAPGYSSYQAQPQNYPSSYDGMYDNYYSAGYQTGFIPNQTQPQSTFAGTSTHAQGVGAPYSRRLPLHRPGYQHITYSQHPNSAPPSTSSSISDVETCSASFLQKGFTSEEQQDEYALAYPHVLEQNSEPFEYHMDVSQRPESLQDAISMYIDYLIAENEHKTRISHSVQMNMSSPLSDETYYRSVLGKPIPFPTDKFLQWLKLFNLDIEITDLEGNTTPQTLFEPTEAMQENLTAIEPTHVMNWQTRDNNQNRDDNQLEKQPEISPSSHAVLPNKSGTHIIVMDNSLSERGSNIFQTSSGTKIMVCETEPDSTTCESFDISNTATHFENCLALNEHDNLECEREKLPDSIDTSKDPDCRDNILQTLMGKSAIDIYKDSPACKTMMSLCELVVSDQIIVKDNDQGDDDPKCLESTSNESAMPCSADDTISAYSEDEKANELNTKSAPKSEKRHAENSESMSDTETTSREGMVTKEATELKETNNVPCAKRARRESNSHEESCSPVKDGQSKRVTRSSTLIH